MRAEKLCQELALKQKQQLRMKEKQGKDKPERGADLGVRTVQYKHNESEVTDDNVASGFFVLNDTETTDLNEVSVF